MKLNLGSGECDWAGWVNLDVRPLPGVHTVADCRNPLPFASDSFTEILAWDIFEHLDDVVQAMDECWRILSGDGWLRIHGPSANSEDLWVDVTHRRAFNRRSFDHFDWSTELGSRHRYGKNPWRLALVQEDPQSCLFMLQPIKEQRS